MKLNSSSDKFLVIGVEIRLASEILLLLSMANCAVVWAAFLPTEEKNWLKSSATSGVSTINRSFFFFGWNTSIDYFPYRSRVIFVWLDLCADVVTLSVLKKMFYRCPGFLVRIPGVSISALSVTTKELISKGHLILNFRCYVRAGTTANSGRLNWCMSIQCRKKSVIKRCAILRKNSNFSRRKQEKNNPILL